MPLALSIDNFIDAHRHDLRKLNGTWYEGFFQRLTENVAKSEADKLFQNVSFIRFNYDRHIEHYLVNALQIYYTLRPEEAQAIVAKLVVRHPYRLVGPLPWQDPHSGVPFGGAASEDNNDLLSIGE